MRILMFDQDVEAHWQRCVDNKEPINRVQFVQAGRLYDELAAKYSFQKQQLGDFSEPDVEGTREDQSEIAADGNTNVVGDIRQDGKSQDTQHGRDNSPEALEEKLERANAIRSLLKSSLVKKKGEIYQNLENDIKNFLEKELENIFTERRQDDFTQDEVQILKIYAQRIKEKMG